MTATNEHLTPELFIDVLENSPVDSRWRQHLAACRECADELRAIEEAYAMVTESERPPSSARRLLFGLAAAAIVALGVGLYAFTALAPTDETAELAADDEMMLPPLGDDEDFALLVAMSGGLSGDSLIEAVDSGTETLTTAPLDWELFNLTPDERAALLERLATETEGGSGS